MERQQRLPDVPRGAGERAGGEGVRSYYELEAQEYLRRGVQLTPDLWLVKLLVGALPASHPSPFPRFPPPLLHRP